MAPLAGPGGAGDFASPGPLSSFPMGARKASEEEEAILVTVRVRPLSPQELAERDVAVWRCTDEKTLTFADNVERSPYPSAYIFDRVFGPVASSEQVYAEAARDLVQSSLTGLNATVFAYGQTSSGKTHTMRAVSRSAVQDIFEHIQRTPQREFLIRVSALEIYNEVVRDLLRPDSGPLRLLDDPERGTVVERLAEEVVRSSGHLYQILEDCEAQRQVGETMLNDNSSRSHQIIRLSVESCPSIEDGRVTGAGGSSHVLMSVLNFVDLAGSERASQTLAEGARLKEGGHINRSLLTLGTVIRKLGESNKLRRGHIPYRDSKLTRILQHSLGGNARTAIICTMSPARAHVEQTRNTLSFATRAKEVTNSAHINLVVSDKVLIKRLQREVSRLEAELAVSANPRELQARDIRIQQIEMQLHELVRQRDAAQAQARELTKAMLKFERGEDGSQKATKSWSPDTVKKLLRRSGKKKKSRLAGGPEEGSVESAPLFATSASRFLEYKEMRERRKERQREREREREAEAHLLDGEKRKLETMQEQLGQGADLAMQALQKEIECLRLAQAQAVVGGAKSEDIAGMIDKLQAELAGLQAAQRATALEGALPEDEPEGAGPVGGRASAVNASMERMIQLLRDELARLQSATKADEKADQEISALEEKLESAQLSLDKFYDGANGDDPLLSSGRRVLAPRSPGGANFSGPPSSPPLLRRSPSAGEALPLGDQENDENAPGAQENGHHSAPEDGEKTPRRGGASSVDIRRMQSLFKTAAEDNVRSIKNYVTELKERIAKLHYQKQLLVCQVLELEGAARRSGEESEGAGAPSPEAWAARCEEQAAAIVQLWDMCNVSLFHRTQFYRLFSAAAPSDHVYLEVEQRRLEWLREQCLLTLEDGHEEPRAIRGSFKRLRYERDVLARRMRQRLSDSERGLLYEQWGVPLTSKARKQQLAGLVWNNPFDAKHVRDSADLVALLMDFGDESAMVPKEMFGLKFAQPGRKKSWLMRIASTG